MRQCFARLLRAARYGSVAALALAAAACDTSFYTALGEKVSVARVAISPATATVPASGGLTFTASGGSPPYAYSMVSGLGSVNASTGAYIASGTAGTEYVQVKDSKGGASTATVTVVSTAGPLAITPTTVSMTAGGSITFVASGGTPPYTFSMSATGSAPPSPTVNSGTGAYTAGSNPGTDKVTVTDAASSTPATATITVTAATSTVNYGIPSETLPGTGPNAIAGTALPGGFSFTIQNGGTGNGQYPVSWSVFLSPTPTPGSGTVLLESGTTAGGLAAAGSTVIPLSWTWPSVPPVLPGQTRYLYILVSAQDDLTPSNNSFAGPAFTLAPPDVDYTVPPSTVNSTGGTTAGGAVAGSFTLQNGGTATGSQPVSWTAYYSTDSTATIDAGAVPLSSGTASAQFGGGSAPVTFGGTWPSTPGSYYLKVSVSSSDDVNTSNNVQVSASSIPVTVTNVDYTFTAVANTGATVAGAAMGGNFTLKNSGSAAGTQTVSWSVYISTSPSVGAGSTLAASGTNAALGAGASTSPVGFSGTWPSSAGTYYLVAVLSASDDSSAANNTVASSAVPVTTISPDYAVSAVSSTGGTVAGAAMSGSFTLTNAGTANGSQAVSWSVYISTSASIGAGSTLAASGTTAALGTGGSTPVSFSGSWPSSAGTYYLVAAVSAPDDTTTANNTAPSSGVTVNPASVDYKITSISLPGGTINPAGSMSGSLQFSNIGADNGTQYVTWQVYASHDTVLDGSDVLLASGTNPPINAGGSSSVIPFTGTWPLTYGAYYLIAKVTVSADVDINPANNVAANASATTIGVYAESEPNNDYTTVVTVNTLPVTLQPGMSVKVTGSLSYLTDPWDVFQFNTGTAVSVSFSMTWTNSETLYMYLFVAGNTYSQYVSTTGTILSMPWTVDASTNRWIGLNDNSGLLGAGSYTLIINAN